MAPHASLDAFRYDRIPSEHLQEHLESVAMRNGFKRPRYEVRPGSKAGDNYASLLYRVEVSDEEDKDRKLSVMVKSTVQSAAFRSAMKLFRAFANEANIYNIVFPAYADKLREKGLLDEGKTYPDVPRCYMASVGNGVDEEKDVVILQDMRPEGFVLYDRHQGVDLQHCRLVLGALANLHAMSLAMEHLHPKQFQLLKDSVTEFIRDDVDLINIFDKDPLTKNTLEMIKDKFPEGTGQYKRAKDYCDTVRQDIIKVVEPHPEGGNVICHGDCWTNNILFKYSESGKVERMCFLDFQLARFASPVLDLVYFLFTCTEKALRDEHLDGLLRWYHAALQTRMRALGVEDPDAVFSWRRLQAHLQYCGRFGFIMGILAIPVFAASQEDAPDVGAVLDAGGNMKEAFVVKCSDTAERDRRVSDLLEDMVERGYI